MSVKRGVLGKEEGRKLTQRVALELLALWRGSTEVLIEPVCLPEQ